MRSIVAAVFTLGFIAGPAAAIDLPSRKAGLWQMSMSFEGRAMPPQVMKHCVDAATDKDMIAMTAASRQDCTPADFKQVGNTYVVDTTCKFGNATVTSHSVVSGDFNSAYTVNVESKAEGGPAMPGAPAGGVSKMAISAKWLGACEAGQKPGDIIMANGMKMNIHDAPPGRPGAPPRTAPQR